MAINPQGNSGSNPTGKPAAPSNPGTALTVDQQSAKANIAAALSLMDLPSLADFAWNEFLNGVPEQQIYLDIRQTQEYKNRFPAEEELGKRGQGISEAAYIGYEQQIFSLAQANGLPKSMYTTPDQIAKMLINGVSVNEASDRMSQAVYAAYTAPASVRAAMADQWGVASGDLVGLYLDSDKALPLIQQQFAAASVAGAGSDVGLAVDKTTAQQLAAQGVTYGQAAQGLGQVANIKGLTAGFGETVDQNTEIAAQFGNGVAQAKQTRVQRGRLAAYGPSGQAAAANTGVEGLGSSKGF